MPRLLLSLVAVALLGGGCSIEGGQGDESDRLLDRLPSDSRYVAVVDLAAAREALGLQENADLGDGPDLRLTFAAGYGIPHVRKPDFDDDPIADALEIGRVQVAATGGETFGEVTLVETGQPVEEVLDRMVEGEYERQGDVVVHPEGASQIMGVTYGAAADADGLLVLAHDEEALDAALDVPSGEAPWRELIDGVDGPLRAVANIPDGICLEGIAASDSIEPREGEVLVDVAGTPEADRLAFLDDADEAEGGGRRGPFGETRFDEAEESGDFLRVPFDYGADEPFALALGALTADVPRDSFYDCR